MSVPDSQRRSKGPDAPTPEELKERERSLQHLVGYAEGDLFPLLQKRIKALLAKNEDYMVFLDENDLVEWVHNEMEFDERFGEISRGIGNLQELSSSLLPARRRFDFRYGLAHAAARAFDGDIPTAELALKNAEDRLREQVRLLYVVGGLSGGASFSLLGLSLWLYREPLQHYLGAHAFVALLAACAGALGALVSVLLRKRLPLTSAAASLYFIDGLTRIVLGAIGGFIAGIAIRAGILGVFKQDYPSVLAGSTLAGAVERFVPGLVRKTGLIDSKTSKQTAVDPGRELR